MNVWSVSLTKRAATDLDQIFSYIATTLLEPETATRQVSRIRDSLLKLDHFPERCSLLAREPWQSQGLRYLVIDNYMAIFKLNEDQKAISIITIVYAKRNLRDLL